ncbi:MAG: PilZ domain-containing protein [Planctomycetaceae bacterium]|nr:PilZ domain-containing protein [Planctomycetaceae bacterium]
MAASESIAWVELRWTERDGTPRAQTAEVQSLDRNTVRLTAESLLPFGQPCQLVFGGVQAGQVPLLDAIVRDVRPWKFHGCRVTCHFTEPLADDVLKVLSDAGCFNRRSHERRPVSVDVEARPELTQGQANTGVRVVDLSLGGCCLKSPTDVQLGYRIMLSAEGEAGKKIAIPLRVQWKQPTDDGYLLGCSFCQTGGYQQLASIALDHTVSDKEHTTPRLLDRVFYLAKSAVGLGTPATSPA